MRWRGHARDFSAPLKGACGREWDPLWERFRDLYRSLGRPVPFACAVALAIIFPTLANRRLKE